MEKKSDVVAAVAAGAGLTQAQAAAAIEAYSAAALDALKAGGSAVLPGLGKFTAAHKAAREGRNPRTGETVHVEEKYVPFFKTGKLLRDRLNGKS